MNMKCEHCGYEGPVETFRYLYNIRLNDSDAWRECPKCFGWNFYNALTGKIDSFEEHAGTYEIHSDQGVGVPASGVPVDLGIPEDERYSIGWSDKWS